MSGFLASLVARARGEAQVIRPRLPSRFEMPMADTPADNAFGEIVEEFPPEAPPSAQPALDDPVAKPDTPPQPAPGTLGVRRPATPGTEDASVPPAAAPEQRANEFAPPTAAIGSPVPGAPSRAEHASSAPSPPGPITVIRETVETRIVPQPIVPARVNVAPAPPARTGQNVPPFVPRQQQNPARQQTIEVTIGRIEVRATQPASVPNRAAAPSPVMGLDDYLRARARGGR